MGIAEAASEWVRHGNLKLEFTDPGTGEYRSWTPVDEQYEAEVRISFEPGGYWSLVGRDSVNPAIVSPGDASMNFDGFDCRCGRH